MNGGEHPAARCVTCGAVLAHDATICAGCGTPVASIPPVTRSMPSMSVLQPAPVATDASELGENEMTATTEEAAAGADGSADAPQPVLEDANARLCEWCGARNPLDAERCTSCGAVFARPEQDALLQRVFQEKMALAEQDEQRRQRKRGLWGLF